MLLLCDDYSYFSSCISVSKLQTLEFAVWQSRALVPALTPALTPGCVLTDKLTDLVCLKNTLTRCGLAAVTSLKPVRMWRQSGSRYQVNCVRCACALCCLSVCVRLRMHAGITGFSWLSRNGILVADTPNLSYGGLLRMWPRSCIFASVLQL